jgi:hypothetical protein
MLFSRSSAEQRKLDASAIKYTLITWVIAISGIAALYRIVD